METIQLIALMFSGVLILLAGLKIWRQESENERLQGIIEFKEQQNERDAQEIETLTTKLEKAQRNDTPKDPKTGRFIKKGK